MDNSRRVPLWATLKETFSLTASLYRQLLKISVFWLLAVFFAAGVTGWLRWPPTAPQDGGTGLALSAIMTIATVSMAVGWHRMILLQEEPAFPYRRIDRIVLFYAALVVASQMAGWPIREAIAWTQPIVGHLGTAFLSTVVAIVFLAVMSRLSLLLPGLAVEDTRGVVETVRRIWVGTRGNSFILMLGYAVIAVFSVLVVAPLFSYGHRLGGGQVGFALVTAVTETLRALLGMLFVTFASLCYWQLFLRDD